MQSAVRRALSIPKRIYRYSRIAKFSLLSNVHNVTGRLLKYQPVLILGPGNFEFEEGVKIGFENSPMFWTSYAFMECRSVSAVLKIGRDTWINNGFSAIVEDTSIHIGKNCLIGPEVLIVDSDFHVLSPERRFGHQDEVLRRPVLIADNVFIGARCTILKGAEIGAGCVVGAGSVVAGKFPENSMIAGNPAKIVRKI